MTLHVQRVNRPRGNGNRVAIAEFFGTILQSNQSIDIDNDLTLHVQRVNRPRGNGNTKRKLAGNMDLNIVLKIYVLQPFDNMMMSLVLVPWSPGPSKYVKRPQCPLCRTPFTNKRYWTEFTIFLTLIISRMDPWTLPSTPNVSPSFHRTAHESLLMPSRGIPHCCIKTKCLTLLAMSECKMLLHENTPTLPPHCQRGFGGCTIAWNAKRHLITRISISVNKNTLVSCVRKRLACTSHPTQDYVNNVWCISQQYLFQQSQQNEICTHTTSWEKCGHWFADRSTIISANHSSVLTVTTEVTCIHECFVEVEKMTEIKSCQYVF